MEQEKKPADKKEKPKKSLQREIFEWIMVFVVAAALHCRCGACFHVIWNQEREAAGLDQTMSEDTSRSVRVAVEAMKLMIQHDRAAEAR